MNRIHSYLACLLSFLAVLTCAAFGQVATGIPPLASIGGGPFDQINLGNLNVHFDIPISRKAGRGLPFTYDLTYDNSIWTPVVQSSQKTWQPSSTWGWQGLILLNSANVTYSTTYTSGHCGQMGQYTWQSWQYSNFVYTDELGTQHSFGYSPSYITSTGTPSQNCPPTGPQPSTVPAVPAADGSGYSLTAIPGQGSASTSIGSTNGVKAAGGIIEDANGNEITRTSGVYTDTLGQTVLTVAGQGTPSSPTTFTYPGPSGTVQYTVNYTSTVVATHFNCSGISEYSGTVNLPTSIQLPDGSSYRFSYYGDGRLEQVTLPTGGTIAYSYSGGSNNSGINCSDGSMVGLTRTLSPGGQWTYTRSYTGNNNLWTNTIVDPSGNTTVVNLAKDNSGVTTNFYETQRLMYQGSTSGTLLLTTYNCWNGDQANCAFDVVSSPIVQENSFRKLSSGSLAVSALSYSGPFVIEDKEYDWGYVAGHSAPITDTVTNYTQLTNGMVVPSSVVVSGGLAAQTTYTYDEGTPTPTSGTPQHLSITGARGNVTTIKKYTSASAYLTQKFTYYDTGNAYQATDANNNAVTTYSYGACGNGFATQVNVTSTNPTSINLTNSGTWNCVGGVQLTSIDANNNTTTTNYTDPYFWRPASVQYPDGGETSINYISPTETQTTSKINSSENLVTTTILDGFGRTQQQQLNSDPTAPDYSDTTYNNLGQVNCVSNPYHTSGDPTYGKTCYQYDALGRTIQITNPDNTYRTITYTNRATEVQDEGNGTNRVTKIYQNDGLGRLTSVCEVTNTTQRGNGGTPSPCGQDIAMTGFLSSYSYDALGNLLSVSQNGLNGRTYTYDMLSRLTSETNPETNNGGTVNTISYSYDSCSAGDLCSRTAPQPNQTGSAQVVTSYSYDALHRLTQTSYSDGVTPSVFRSYDTCCWWGYSQTNTNGRLQEEWVGTSCCGSQAQIFGYDSMGRVILNVQCTLLNCGNPGYAMDYAYDLLGDITSLYNSREGVTYTNTYNAAAELTNFHSNEINSTHPGTLYTVNQYNALGQATQSTYGNGIINYDQFDNRGRLTSRAVGPSNNYGGLYTVSLGYAGNNDVLEGFDSINGSWYYAYDDFNRLRAATLSGEYEYSYAFDRFGNRWQQSGGPLDPSYNFDTNNHISGSGVVYDATGNIINDGVGHSYTYDAEGRMTAVDGGSTANYVYDASGRRVEETVEGGSATDFIYDMQGHLVTEATASSWQRSELYVGNNHVALYANSTTYFMHNDWLGSTKQQSDMSGNSAQTCTYGPYGDGFSCPGSQLSLMSFTGDQWDGETGQSHTLFRQYNPTQGRWMTPDPGGVNVVDPTNPQTWNRYAYAMNNPMSLVDSLGEDSCYFGGSDGVYFGNLDAGICDSMGGFSLPGGYFLGSNGLPYTMGLGGNGQPTYFGPNGEDVGDGGDVGLPTLPALNSGTLLSLSLSGDGTGGGSGQGGGGSSGSVCTSKVLSAVNNQFGTNFTSANVGTGANAPFQWPQVPGGTVNIDIFGQTSGISPGRYPVHWWTYVIGYGSTLHIPAGVGGLDGPATLAFSSSQFTAHLDSAFPYNPIGGLVHWLKDVEGIGGHSPCP